MTNIYNDKCLKKLKFYKTYKILKKNVVKM